MKYLIWISAPLGPQPQLCYDKPVDGSGKPKPSLIIHEVADDDHRSLKQLAEAYPVPQIEAKG